jgi:hypothetical protein
MVNLPIRRRRRKCDPWNRAAQKYFRLLTSIQSFCYALRLSDGVKWNGKIHFRPLLSKKIVKQRLFAGKTSLEVNNRTWTPQSLYDESSEITENLKNEFVTRRRGRRRKQLLDDLGDRRGYSHLKEEALDRIKWRTRFGRRCGPVVCLTDYWWMNHKRPRSDPIACTPTDTLILRRSKHVWKGHFAI